MTVHELRKLGYKVRVTHFRRHLSNPKIFLRRDEINGDNIITQTGVTRLEVRLLNGEEVSSLYLHQSNYNKKIGVSSCIERLLHFFEKNE